MPQVAIPKPVKFVLDQLESNGFEVYVVGGAVRDVLLGNENVLDWDVTTNATPEEVMPLFGESFYDNAFGTVMVAVKHVAEQMEVENVWEDLEVLDITTFRTESGYGDRRRPDKVEWGESLEEDLQRRDFTVNAMALKIQNANLKEQNDIEKIKNVHVEAEIIDLYEGLKDLGDKVIRAVGDAGERFEEDALRMMRAIRIGARMGFIIEKKTLEAIREKAPLIQEISWERIRDELMKILASDYPADGIMLMHAAGLLEFILPEVLETEKVEQGGHHIYDVWKHSIESLRECPSRDPIVRLATLLHDVGKPRTMRKQGPRGVTFYGHEVVGARMVKVIADRLRLSKKEKEKLFTLVRWHMFVYAPEMTDAAIRRFIRRVGRENINDMMMLRIGDRKGGGSRATSWRLRELQKRIGENLYTPMSVRDLVIGGNEVMEMLKIKPGPMVGMILEKMFTEVMEGNLENEKTVLLTRAKEIFVEET